ncbi:hypothetical protein E4U43_000717 [Claviceps pusilla]|uniref:Uncharacterized protein n=1 Tax=Claviceps pusilla TaxID=123648 RepID=A0A9P7NBI0_9HYPO|nr:hypothetical protein E4U43_000717 [Claviceps pusilla]
MLDGRNGTLGVTRSVAERLAKRYGQAWLDSTVRLRHQGQERFMAQLELNHQIHCLHELRMATHFDYYHDKDPRQMHGHLDHCIETIREALMCNSGTGIVLFHWIAGDDKPYPDYNTYHQCRDPFEVLNWAVDRSVPIVAPLTKPANQPALQTPPY